MPQWQKDQHAIAHADGFVGPRIGEVYGDGRSREMAPTNTGGQQISPANGFLHSSSTGNKNLGTGDRMAHLDNVVPETKPRMMQHKDTGNIVEVQTFHNGDRVNDYGTTAGGRSFEPRQDVNMNPGGKRYGAGIDHNSENYTDITDTVRSTQTYKEGRNR
jgi:hypothetical protein